MGKPTEKPAWRLGLDGPDKAVVVDVETTGLYPTATKKDPHDNHIISVCCLPVTFQQDGGMDRGEPSTWIVKPGRSIPPQVTKINGFRDRDVRDCPPFSEVAQEIRDFIGSLPLVGYNVSFDKRFLSAEFKRAGVRTLLRSDYHCLMAAVPLLMDSVGWKGDRFHMLSLNQALELFNTMSPTPLGRTSKTHTAGEDVELTARLAGLLHILFNIPRPDREAAVGEMVRAWPGRSGREDKAPDMLTQGLKYMKLALGALAVLYIISFCSA